jgi:sulfur carrier protein
MEVMVNGNAREIDETATVADLVAESGNGRGGRGLAVAVNGEVVARTAWPDHHLRAGDRVEILKAIGGG